MGEVHDKRLEFYDPSDGEDEEKNDSQNISEEFPSSADGHPSWEVGLDIGTANIGFGSYFIFISSKTNDVRVSSALGSTPLFTRPNAPAKTLRDSTKASPIGSKATACHTPRPPMAPLFFWSQGLPTTSLSSTTKIIHLRLSSDAPL